MGKRKDKGVDIVTVEPPIPVESNGETSFMGGQKKGPGSTNSGTIGLPSYASDPAVSKKKGNLSFTEAIDSGMSPNRGDVNALVPNGDVSSSKGQGKTINYQWAGENISGYSNKIRGWPGGNRTGE